MFWKYPSRAHAALMTVMVVGCWMLDARNSDAQTLSDVPAASSNVPVLIDQPTSATGMPLVPPSLHRSGQPTDAQLSPNWWQNDVTQPVMDGEHWVTFDLPTIISDTLNHSPEISIANLQTSIANERIIQERAAFDASVLFDGGLERVNDPVGNTLTTGGPPRLIEQGLISSAGVTKRTTHGGVFDLSQSLGLDTSNSQFFLPADQANTRLSVSFTQPLLGRGGELYNTRLVAQARINQAIASTEVQAQIATRLGDTNEAYWSLYRQRCYLLQKQSLHERIGALQRIIDSRSHWDTGRLSVAKAQLKSHQVSDEIVQIAGALAKHQSDLVRLVGSPSLASANVMHEMIPTTPPSSPTTTLSLDRQVQSALEQRPEMRQVAARIESAALQVRISRAELKPQLSAVVGGYLSGLTGDFRAGRALTNQFDTGGPGLSAGLNYEMPQGRRAARSQHREAMHQLTIANEQLRQTMTQIRFEVETAMIEYETNIRRLDLKTRALDLAREEESILQSRFERGIDDVSNVGVVIESLLDAHHRRTDAESAWVDCLTQIQISWVRLQQAGGGLLRYESIESPKVGEFTGPVNESENDSTHSLPSANPSLPGDPFLPGKTPPPAAPGLIPPGLIDGDLETITVTEGSL